MKILLITICLLFTGCTVKYENDDKIIREETNYTLTKCNNKMLMMQDGNGFWYYPKDTTNTKAWIECK